MKLHELIGYLHPFVDYKGENPEITSIENDNRRATPGSLFICIKGYTVDGHDFAESAVKNGAAAVLAERELPVNVPVIVVKDTVRAMAVLADAFYGQLARSFIWLELQVRMERRRQAISLNRFSRMLVRKPD